jgi:hypothetical protein
MGMFGDFKQSLRESPGRILWGQLTDTRAKLAALPDNVRAVALMGFVDKREGLLTSLDNISSEGKVETGRSLQKKARETFNFNMAEGHALWMTGAWLESMERPGLEAAKTHDFLDRLGSQLKADM